MRFFQSIPYGTLLLLATGSTFVFAQPYNPYNRSTYYRTPHGRTVSPMNIPSPPGPATQVVEKPAIAPSISSGTTVVSEDILPMDPSFDIGTRIDDGVQNSGVQNSGVQNSGVQNSGVRAGSVQVDGMQTTVPGATSVTPGSVTSIPTETQPLLPPDRWISATIPSPLSAVSPTSKLETMDECLAKLAKLRIEHKDVAATLALTRKINDPVVRAKTLTDLAEYVAHDPDFKTEAAVLFNEAAKATLALGGMKPDDLPELSGLSQANEPAVSRITGTPVETMSETPRSPGKTVPQNDNGYFDGALSNGALVDDGLPDTLELDEESAEGEAEEWEATAEKPMPGGTSLEPAPVERSTVQPAVRPTPQPAVSPPTLLKKASRPMPRKAVPPKMNRPPVESKAPNLTNPTSVPAIRPVSVPGPVAEPVRDEQPLPSHSASSILDEDDEEELDAPGSSK
ncbi:MAG TPA: hypothetical protein DEB39_08775 [Planctomycetaceae bacterium]|nr:hypothetical protein [Planctomycetaceae bacterium]